jgi:ankyrin repeat protein
MHKAARFGQKEVVELLIAKGADVNAKNDDGVTPLDTAIVGFAFVAQGKVTMHKHPELADLLRKQGGKTGEELKAEGK